MSGVSFETSQNVSIEYQYASLSKRIWGWVIDALIIFAFFVGMFYINSLISIGSVFDKIGILMFTPVFLYDMMFEMYFNGQSPGKMILKTRVIKIDGSAPNFVSYFLRWIFRVVDISISMGGVAITTYMITGKGQRLGDIVAGTTVIDVLQPKKPSSLVFAEYDGNYTVTYSEAGQLKDKDILLLREILERFGNPEFSEHHKQELLFRTAHLLKAKMGVEVRPTEHTLRTIIADYQYLTSR